MLSNPTLVVRQEPDGYAYSAHLLGTFPVRYLNADQLRAVFLALREVAGGISVQSGQIVGLAVVVEGHIDANLSRFLQAP